MNNQLDHTQCALTHAQAIIENLLGLYDFTSVHRDMLEEAFIRLAQVKFELVMEADV